MEQRPAIARCVVATGYFGPTITRTKESRFQAGLSPMSGGRRLNSTFVPLVAAWPSGDPSTGMKKDVAASPSIYVSQSLTL
jgi:hypothetical protein